MFSGVILEEMEFSLSWKLTDLFITLLLGLNEFSTDEESVSLPKGLRRSRRKSRPEEIARLRNIDWGVAVSGVDFSPSSTAFDPKA